MEREKDPACEEHLQRLKAVRLDPRESSPKVSPLLNLNSGVGTSLITLKIVRRSTGGACAPVPGLALSTLHPL